MNFTFGLGKLINPAIAINIVKKQLKKQFKKDVEIFDIVYDHAKDKLSFLIDNKSYHMDSENLKTAIKMQTVDLLEDNQELTYVVLQVNFESIFAKIFYTENNEKLFVEHKIN